MMFGFGLTGETGGINAQVEFVFGMSGWAYILYVIYLDDAGRVAGNCSAAVKDALSYVRVIITAG